MIQQLSWFDYLANHLEGGQTRPQPPLFFLNYFYLKRIRIFRGNLSLSLMQTHLVPITTILLDKACKFHPLFTINLFKLHITY
jgi:hypothetical protein